MGGWSFEEPAVAESPPPGDDLIAGVERPRVGVDPVLESEFGRSSGDVAGSEGPEHLGHAAGVRSDGEGRPPRPVVGAEDEGVRVVRDFDPQPEIGHGDRVRFEDDSGEDVGIEDEFEGPGV